MTVQTDARKKSPEQTSTVKPSLRVQRKQNNTQYIHTYIHIYIYMGPVLGTVSRVSEICSIFGHLDPEGSMVPRSPEDDET